MWKYFRLVRIYNLLFILLIQVMIIQFVLSPIMQMNGIDNSGSMVYYILLLITSVLIAAGGYVINDYFDVKIDSINKPDRQLIGKSIERNMAVWIYQGLTISGVVSGLILSWLLGDITVALIFIAISGLLWFYSASYKRQLFIGNFMIAFIAGLYVFIVVILQTYILKERFGVLIFDTRILVQMYAWNGGFAFFSFLLTLIREIIKDMEDITGDRELECRTLPIVWGVSKTKVIILGLVLIIIALLLVIALHYIPFEGSLSLRYIIVGIILPLVLLAYMIYNAKQSSDYHQASTLTKFIMLIGILYTLIFNYLLAKEEGIMLFNKYIIQ